MNRLLMLVTLPTTTLGLVVVAAHSAFLDDGPLAWEATKILVSAVLLLSNALVLRRLLAPSSSGPSPQAVVGAGACQIALGASAFTWTLHLASVTGDFEGAIASLAGLVTLQGLLVLLRAIPSRITTSPYT